LHKLLPTEIPEHAEDWRDVMKDFDQFIMSGITHWQSPNFHAYYPTSTSFPSIVGEILSAGLGENKKFAEALDIESNQTFLFCFF